MNTYLRLITIGLKQTLEFRARLFIWFLCDLAPFVVVPFFWTYVLFTTPEAVVSQSYIITYYVLILLVSTLTAMHVFMAVEDDIIRGGLMAFLARPISYVGYTFLTSLGAKVTYSLLSLGLFGSSLFLFPEYILAPRGVIEAFFFVVFLGIALVLSFLFQMSTACISFWWGRSGSIMQIRYWFEGLFGGQFAPLMFYPSLITSLATFLPFRFLYAVPVETYLGNYSMTEMIILFFLGIFWVLCSYLIFFFFWNKGVRNYDAPSG